MGGGRDEIARKQPGDRQGYTTSKAREGSRFPVVELGIEGGHRVSSLYP